MLAIAAVSLNTTQAAWAFFQAEKAMAIFKDQGENRQQVYLIQADEHVSNALSLWPDNPDYLALAASIHVWQKYLLGDPEQLQQAYSEALPGLRKAIAARPSNAQSWAMLAEYKAQAGQRDKEMFNAIEKALELGGANQQLVTRMMKL